MSRPKGLTAKQESFAVAVAQGKHDSLADAYREHYNAEQMSSTAIHVEASRLMANPKVTLRVQQIRADIDRSITAAAVSDRDKVLAKLRELLETDDGGSHINHQLTAARLLGQSVGLYKDVVETEDKTRTPDEIRAEIEQRLGLLHESDDTQH
ncbi:MAG: terminase small subunit [Planctomycetota bacterium]